MEIIFIVFFSNNEYKNNKRRITLNNIDIEFCNE